ncbi:MAG: hypothetical protein E3J72_10835 [Planctomycetota bacterium]|nr:MAG: hypothetical protein E3J72_10835 [Planctomycetota bacterium]
MKLSLPLKLTIFIVLLFAAVIATCMLWTPVRYMRYRSHLRSDDKTVRANAVKKVAAEGLKAIPYVRRWLISYDEKLTHWACLALDRMEGDLWEKALPELESILKGNPSKLTDAASVVACRAIPAYREGMGPEMRWKYFSKQKAAKRNICIYLLGNSTDANLRWRVANELGLIGDEHAVRVLKSALKNEPDSRARCNVTRALGRTRDIRAMEPLIEALENDSDTGVRGLAAGALGGICDERAVKPLINAFVNDPENFVFSQSAYALGFIGDMRAVEPLINALQNSSGSDRQRVAAEALGEIGDPRAIEPLIKNLREKYGNSDGAAAIALGKLGDRRAVEPLLKIIHDTDGYWKHRGVIMALGALGDIRAERDLMKTLKEKHCRPTVNGWAVIALAAIDSPAIKETAANSSNEIHSMAAISELTTVTIWEKSPDGVDPPFGEPLSFAQGPLVLVGGTSSDFLYCTSSWQFRHLALARWGKVENLKAILYELPHESTICLVFYRDVFSRMPENFPEYDFKAKYRTRKKQAKAVKKWFETHSRRIAWNADKRKYYLKPENTENKK